MNAFGNQNKSDNHPSNEDLIDYVSEHKMNILSKQEEQEIEDHLSDCQECRELAQYIKEGDSVVGGVLATKHMELTLSTKDDDEKLFNIITSNFVQRNSLEEKDLVVKKDSSSSLEKSTEQIYSRDVMKFGYYYKKISKHYKLLTTAASIIVLASVCRYLWQPKPDIYLTKIDNNLIEAKPDFQSSSTNINSGEDDLVQNSSSKLGQIAQANTTNHQKPKTTSIQENTARNSRQNLDRNKSSQNMPKEVGFKETVLHNKELTVNRQEAQLNNTISFGRGQLPTENMASYPPILLEEPSKETLREIALPETTQDQREDSFRGASANVDPNNINPTGLFLKTLDSEPISPIVQQLLEIVNQEHSLFSLPIVDKKTPTVVTIIIFTNNIDGKMQLRYQAFYNNQPIIPEQVLWLVGNNTGNSNEISALFIKALTKSLAFLSKKSEEVPSEITPG